MLPVNGVTIVYNPNCTSARHAALGQFDLGLWAIGDFPQGHAGHPERANRNNIQRQWEHVVDAYFGIDFPPRDGAGQDRVNCRYER
jgi:hypothetical protein